MTNRFNNFSATDIHILENGLRWIKEEEDTFANNFYHRLLENHLGINLFLQSIGPWSFGRHLIRSLESIIRDFREYGEMITPLKDLWPELSSSPMSPSEPSEMITMAEIFIDLVSEPAEDAWSPVLEYAWRKAGKSVMTGLLDPVKDPSILSTRSDTKPFQFNTGERRSMTQPMGLHVGPMMLIAGGIAALGLWIRCHVVEARTKAKKPLQFSVCS